MCISEVLEKQILLRIEWTKSWQYQTMIPLETDVQSYFSADFPSISKKPSLIQHFTSALAVVHDFLFLATQSATL